MSLIRLDFPVNRISGRTGFQAATWTHNGGAQIIRQQNTVANPRTPNQEEARAILTTFSRRWSSVLNSAQRAAWNEYAANNKVKNRLGQMVTRSGLSAYIGAASISYMRTATLTPSDDAPTVPKPAPVTDISSVQIDEDSLLTFSIDHGNSVLTGLFLMVKITPPAVTVGRKPRITELLMIGGPGEISFQPLAAPGVAQLFLGTDTPPFGAVLNSIIGVSCEIVDVHGQSSGSTFAIKEVDSI